MWDVLPHLSYSSLPVWSVLREELTILTIMTCDIKHWYACGADGWKLGRSVYGHVIAKFSGSIDFLSYGSTLKIQNWARDQIKY